MEEQYKWWLHCPTCSALTNPCRQSWFVGDTVASPATYVVRDCPNCGKVNFEYLVHKTFECQQCGNDLRGNVSPTCSECGWEMPENFRLYLVELIREHKTFECQQCGYDLRGNVSPACSECGWEIPEKLRSYLDELMRTQDE